MKISTFAHLLLLLRKADFMEQMTAREQVLKAVRDAQVEGRVVPSACQVDWEQPVFQPLIENGAEEDSLAIRFAQALDASEGFFIYCNNDTELVESLKKVIEERQFSPVFTNDPNIELLFTQTDIPYCHQPEALLQARVVVSFCDALVARYGAVVLSSALSCGMVGNAFPDVRFIIAFPEQLVAEVSDVPALLQQKYGENQPSVVSLMSGPGRTHAIELQEIIGVHGNREVYVFYVDKN